jgi:hypothetical protein
MKITLTADQLGQVRDEGTVIVLTGTEDETGDLVTFGADRNVFIRTCGDLLQGTGRVTFEVEPWQELERVPLRRAVIKRSSIGGPTGEVVRQYLPACYEVTGVTDTEVSIAGHDDHGWTLDGYVIPRLASGLIFAKEVKSLCARATARRTTRPAIRLRSAKSGRSRR